MSQIMVYVTHENLGDAKDMCKILIERNIIACANFHSIESMYEWEGEIKDEVEVVSILKTSSEKWEDLKSEIEKIHPYDTPCIAKIGVEYNDKFSKWIETETKNEG